MVKNAASPSTEPQLIYNGACPVCDAGVQAFRSNDGRVAYTDIVAAPEVLEAHALTAEDVQHRVHAVVADGRLVRGVDAVAVMLRARRGWRWAGALLGLPGLRQFGWLAYEIAAFLLFRWNKWKGNF